MNAKLGGRLGAWLLDRITRRLGPEPWIRHNGDTIEQGTSRLERMFGANVGDTLAAKRVVDFGAGTGVDAIAAAAMGADQVYGFEIRENDLASATSNARSKGVGARCEFIDPRKDVSTVNALRGTIDVVYSIDAFEHYRDPAAILDEMYRLLKPDGALLVSFGPPWKHPYGAHMGHFNRMPWIHFLFRERTIFEVRAKYWHDGARVFEESGDGLNRMTVAKFFRLVAGSGFEFRSLQLDAVKNLRLLTRLPVTREYFTSVVRAELVKTPIAPRERPGAAPGSQQAAPEALTTP